MSSYFNFQLTRGDTTPIGGTLTITSGGVTSPYPIQPTDVVRFAAKRHFEDPDSAALFFLTSPTRVFVIDPINGVIRFSILPSDWQTAFPLPIRRPVTLVADVQLSSSDGATVYTLSQGVLFINPDVVAVSS